jgi:hypothetical protein
LKTFLELFLGDFHLGKEFVWPVLMQIKERTGESAFYDVKYLFLVEIIGKQQSWLLAT